MSQATADDFRQTGELLLRLYQGVREQPMEGFREWVLGQLESVIAFDSAMWGSASDQPRQMHEVCLYRQPAAMLESYVRYQEVDFLRDEVCRVPGKTVNLADLMPREQLERQTIYREHAIPFRAVQVLCTAEVDSITTLIHTLVLFRGDVDCPFSERDRQIKQFLFPHLLQLARDNCFVHMRRQCSSAPELYRVAVSDLAGVLQQVEPGFVDLLREEWPDWHGACLPDALGAPLADSGDMKAVAGRSIHVRVQRTARFVLLQARRLTPADRLTPREREVARAYADGMSHKAIARELDLSPSTVRNQLQAAYRKLDIHDKSQLFTALRPLL